MKTKSLFKFDATPKNRLLILPVLFALVLIASSCGRAKDPEPEPTVAPTAAVETATQSEATETEAEEEADEEAPADAVTLPTPTPAAETEAEDAAAESSPEEAAPVDAEESADAPHGGPEGMAAYMSDEFHGQATASGITYDKDGMMAAHKTLPFESEVIVTNPETGKSVTVIIVDRLPERAESIIDVSSAAAVELDMLDAGMVWVVLEPAGE